MQPSLEDTIGGAGRATAAGAESTSASAPASAPDGGGRAQRFGPRAVSAAGVLAALLIVGVLVVLLLTTGGGSTAGRRPQPGVASTKVSSYGGLPAWLPKPKVHVGRVLHASVLHPALSIQGEAVSVDLASGRLLATAVGPEVPEEGRFPVPPVTPVTFLVTFASASKAIPLSPSAFTLIDEQGKVYHPKMTAFGGGAPPARITPGRPISVKLHDILPTGDGGLSWTPEGARPIVTWDYTVEID